MKIIDFARRGNVVRFYLGEDDLKDWHGDDWNDTPYEYNAGPVYPEFVSGYADVSFPFDSMVLEPRDGELNSPWCKDDMKARRVPCIIVVPLEARPDGFYFEDFKSFVGDAGVKRYYFGDSVGDGCVGKPPEMSDWRDSRDKE